MCEELKHGGACDVPRHIATCPECGADLHAESFEWDLETGAPTAAGLGIDMIIFPPTHRVPAHFTRELNQAIGLPTHRRDYYRHTIPSLTDVSHHTFGNSTNPLGRPDRSATKFHYHRV